MSHNIIYEVLTKAWQDNIQYAVLMCFVLAFLHIANIVLGIIIGSICIGFDWKKMLLGIVKALAVIVTIVCCCYILNVLVLTVNLIDGIEIKTEVVSTLEVLLILITQAADLAREVLDKIKQLRCIKYDEVDKNSSEPIE